MEFWLPVAWSAVLAFGVIMYVVMDGFDLGVGILFRLAPTRGERDDMMNSVAPIWDGNETWLVLGGAGLFAAFPVAYAVLLPALYLPIIVMLIALIFRGVAFEFRFKASARGRWAWDWAFCGGSALAAFAQGVVLGAFIQGIPVAGTSFAGGPFHWATPFVLLTGLALVAGYGLLGATWLVMKTEGELQARAYGWSRRLLAAVLVFVGAVSLWTPLMDAAIAQRWFSWPNIALLAPVPVVTALAAYGLWRGLERGAEVQPFVLAIALFLLSYLGLGISLFPKVVPPEIDIWQASSPPESQAFILVGTVVLVPVILAYTAYTYRVFRGKVRSGEGYH